MVYLKRILVPTDLSEYSLAALDYAVSLGVLYASQISMIYVVEPASAGHFRHGREREAKGVHDHDENSGLRCLQEFVARYVPAEIKLALHVETGHAAGVICRCAEAWHADVIVMATHGRTGLKHMVLGSVAEKVVRHSSVPVLTVKPPPLRERMLNDEDIENELHLH